MAGNPEKASYIQPIKVIGIKQRKSRPAEEEESKQEQDLQDQPPQRHQQLIHGM